MTYDSDPHDSQTRTNRSIEDMLGNLRPRPSPRFYRRMSNVPWQNHTYFRRNRYLRFAVLMLLFTTLTVLLLSPPLRSLARNWIQYFLPGRQDHIEISVDDLSPSELFKYASPENFPYTVAQAAKLAGYPVFQPSSVFQGMQLVGARYEHPSQSVVLLYQGTGYNLLLSQHPVDIRQEYFSIGASADVEKVTIGDVYGEYVAGGWVNFSNTPVPASTGDIDLQATWDASLPQHTLRWQAHNMEFQLRSTGSHGLDKEELITIAQTIR